MQVCLQFFFGVPRRLRRPDMGEGRRHGAELFGCSRCLKLSGVQGGERLGANVSGEQRDEHVATR